MPAILSPSNDLFYSFDIEPKPKRRKAVRIDKKTTVEVKIKDNTSISIISQQSYLRLFSKMVVWRRLNKLSSEGSELLLFIYVHYLEHGIGITSCSLTSIMTGGKKVTGELQSTRNKLNTLEKRGMLIKLCKSKGGAYVYIPSEIAIRDISNMCV